MGRQFAVRIDWSSAWAAAVHGCPSPAPLWELLSYRGRLAWRGRKLSWGHGPRQDAILPLWESEQHVRSRFVPFSVFFSSHIFFRLKRCLQCIVAMTPCCWELNKTVGTWQVVPTNATRCSFARTEYRRRASRYPDAFGLLGGGMATGRTKSNLNRLPTLGHDVLLSIQGPT